MRTYATCRSHTLQGSVCSFQKLLAHQHEVDSPSYCALVNATRGHEPRLKLVAIDTSTTLDTAADLFLRFVQLSLLLFCQGIHPDPSITISRVKCRHCEKTQCLFNMTDVYIFAKFHLCQTLGDPNNCLQLAHSDGYA